MSADGTGDAALLVSEVEAFLGAVAGEGDITLAVTVQGDAPPTLVPLADWFVWPAFEGAVAGTGTVTLAATVEGAVVGPFTLTLTSDEGSRLVLEGD
jgi:hypothetical protein